MNRRALLASALGASALGAPFAPLSAKARRTKVHRLGALLQGVAPPPGSKPLPLRVALGELGYVAGRNLILDLRWAGSQSKMIPPSTFQD
jgi:hypothetical protein